MKKINKFILMNFIFIPCLLTNSCSFSYIHELKLGGNLEGSFDYKHIKDIKFDIFYQSEFNNISTLFISKEAGGGQLTFCINTNDNIKEVKVGGKKIDYTSFSTFYAFPYIERYKIPIKNCVLIELTFWTSNYETLYLQTDWSFSDDSADYNFIAFEIDIEKHE